MCSAWNPPLEPPSAPFLCLQKLPHFLLVKGRYSRQELTLTKNLLCTQLFDPCQPCHSSPGSIVPCLLAAFQAHSGWSPWEALSWEDSAPGRVAAPNLKLVGASAREHWWGSTGRPPAFAYSGVKNDSDVVLSEQRHVPLMALDISTALNPQEILQHLPLSLSLPPTQPVQAWPFTPLSPATSPSPQLFYVPGKRLPGGLPTEYAWNVPLALGSLVSSPGWSLVFVLKMFCCE